MLKELKEKLSMWRLWFGQLKHASRSSWCIYSRIQVGMIEARSGGGMWRWEFIAEEEEPVVTLFLKLESLRSSKNKSWLSGPPPPPPPPFKPLALMKIRRRRKREKEREKFLEMGCSSYEIGVGPDINNNNNNFFLPIRTRVRVFW